MFVVGPRRILLIQEAVLLVTHLKEIGAGHGQGHTHHITVGGAADDHTLVPPLHTVDAGPTRGAAATVPDLTLQKTVTTGGVADTTLGIIHQTTEVQVGIIHPTTGGVVGVGAGAIGGFLEACRLLQGGTTGVVLLAGRLLGRGGILQVRPLDLVQGVVQVAV